MSVKHNREHQYIVLFAGHISRKRTDSRQRSGLGPQLAMHHRIIESTRQSSLRTRYRKRGNKLRSDFKISCREFQDLNQLVCAETIHLIKARSIAKHVFPTLKSDIVFEK